ncbi:ubiquitin carboxyl-terminal hydrolase UBP14 [Acrasis kona]|uniref:Ubiquitin carboxyl-terminal hydrolase n=1 Tax=Acrasis kona TaxID=1008807 RepID=A0AAW2ZPK6_9EUKA
MTEEVKFDFNRIQIPNQSTLVHKEECALCFDDARSEGGLNIDLNSFYGFCQEHIQRNYQQNKGNVYLNIKKIKKPEQPKQQDEQEEKPSVLALNVEGGFKDEDDQSNYDELLSLVCLDINKVFPLPDDNLPYKIQESIKGILQSQSAERKQDLKSWEAETIQATPYAHDLIQLPITANIPSSGWKCSQCEKTDNLWLCLTCGEISCGRKFFDGTGGNNHGVHHYESTKHPLVVKLGTIVPATSTEPHKADVYCYPQDDLVMDPFLEKHLLHFGIVISESKKTERTMGELELDLNVNYDFNRIQEGEDDKVVYGKGLTGLSNMGNTCYLASVMQVLLTIPEFVQSYRDESFQIYKSNQDVESLRFQLIKLTNALTSGKYSKSASSSSSNDQKNLMQIGIPPRNFKHVIGKDHYEFSSNRQQDSLEFLQYLIQKLESDPSTKSSSPSVVFKFKVEERIECGTSHKVQYKYRDDNVLSVPIPSDSNQDQISKNDGLNRPKVNMLNCIKAFAAQEVIDHYKSSATHGITHALKSTKLVTFPEYLCIQVRKFVLAGDNGYTPKKLDVFVENVLELDLESILKSNGGKLPHEVLLDDDDQEKKEQGVVENERNDSSEIVNQLMEMGISEWRAKRACWKTNYVNVDVALNWAFDHADDPDIDAPLSSIVKNNSSFDDSLINDLMNMGFDRPKSILALKNNDGSVERAIDWLFNNIDNIDQLLLNDNKQSGGGGGEEKKEEFYTDGHGKYELFAMISHLGANTNCGHYVAHIKKYNEESNEREWILFNDRKVTHCQDPPFDMGYLYFYRRKLE